MLGRIKTDKKAASSRENGKLGGKGRNKNRHPENVERWRRSQRIGLIYADDGENEYWYM